MNAEKQRKAIGEHLGWKIYPQEKVSHFGHLLAIDPDGKDAFMPDFLNDLNAMHEAISTLKDQDYLLYIDYQTRLGYVVARDNSGEEEGTPIALVDASASQRAESFLKTVERWEP